MACPRGRPIPNQHTKYRLFADSAGFCQKPDCQRVLFIDTGSTQLHIAEISHVFAASDSGPRGTSDLSHQERSAYENLILLCPSCHAIVDKAPADFPDTLMTEWKRSHVALISEPFGAVRYSSRSAAREVIEPFLSENLLIFTQYGPNNEYRLDPESELAAVWKRKVLAHIIPNNRRILAILEINRCHLREQETATFDQFRQHVDDFEERHLGELEASVGQHFPAGMNAILT